MHQLILADFSLYIFRSENIWSHCVQAGNCSMYCDQRILQMVLSYFPGFCQEIIPNSCWSICDLIWLKSIIYPLCNTYVRMHYLHFSSKVWMTNIIYIHMNLIWTEFWNFKVNKVNSDERGFWVSIFDSLVQKPPFWGQYKQRQHFTPKFRFLTH